MLGRRRWLVAVAVVGGGGGAGVGATVTDLVHHRKAQHGETVSIHGRLREGRDVQVLARLARLDHVGRIDGLVRVLEEGQGVTGDGGYTTTLVRSSSR